MLPIDSFHFASQHHFVHLLPSPAPPPTAIPLSRNRVTSSSTLASEEDGAVDLESAARKRALRLG
jgi:hypothetical protein